MPGGRPKSDVLVRFNSKVKVVESGCHEWQAGLHRDGYGKFQDCQKTVQSHKMAYKLFVGEVPKGACVLHKCDNRLCVNPDHLFLGSLRENIADMDSKGRRGTRSKLTYSQVNEIKKMLVDRYSQADISKKFGVHQTAISRIKLGKTNLFK